MSRRIIAVIAAVVLATVGTTAVFAYVRGADARAIAGQQVENVFITEKVVPAGTTLKAALESGLLVKETVAQKGVPAGALEKVNADNGALVAITDLAAGEVVLASRFGKEETATTAVEIPKGKMAVTVELADPQRVAPFLRAGNEIALFTSGKLRREPKKGGEKGSGDECDAPDVCLTRIVLIRVTVLGVGEATLKPPTPTGEEEAPAEPATAEQKALITLALDQEQAARVIHLSYFGNMHFALLNKDSVVDESAMVTDLDFFAGK